MMSHDVLCCLIMAHALRLKLFRNSVHSTYFRVTPTGKRYVHYCNDLGVMTQGHILYMVGVKSKFTFLKKMLRSMLHVLVGIQISNEPYVLNLYCTTLYMHYCNTAFKHHAATDSTNHYLVY